MKSAFFSGFHFLKILSDTPKMETVGVEPTSRSIVIKVSTSVVDVLAVHPGVGPSTGFRGTIPIDLFPGPQDAGFRRIPLK